MIDILAVAIEAYASNLQELLQTPPTPKALAHYLAGAEAAVVTQLQPLVLSLPDVAHLLRQMIMDNEELLEDRALASAALNYFIMPFDAIPDAEAGIIGILDDAYVMFVLIQKMQSPPNALLVWLQTHQSAILLLHNTFPAWLIQYLEQYLGTVQFNQASHYQE